MKITAQPFGQPLAKERLGKWKGPKIFQNQEEMWEYIEPWYQKRLENDYFLADEWMEISKEEVPDWVCNITRYFDYSAHVGNDFVTAFVFPKHKGMLIVKSADRFTPVE